MVRVTVLDPPGAAAAPGERTPRWTGRESCALVERGTQLERLHQAVTALLFGRSGTVLVTGPRGSGVSTLLREMVTHGRELGLAAATARCSPAERGLRYGVVSQFAAGLTAAGFPVRADASGLPGLCAEFVGLASTHPLLLAVDDPHWADEDSRAWLAAMTSRVRQAPILLVTGAPAGTAGERGGIHVELRPLSTRGVGELVTSRYRGPVAPTFIERAAAASKGSPAVLHQVLDRFSVGRLHPSPEHLPRLERYAHDVESALLAGLPPDVLALLRAVAVAAGHLDSELVLRLADGSESTLDALVRLGLVVRDPRPRVADPAVASAALAALDVAERARLAGRAAALANRAALPARTKAELLLAAPPVGEPWAPEALSVVAAAHRAAGRHADAAALLRRALREPCSADVQARLLVELAGVEAAVDVAAAARRLQRVVLSSSEVAPDTVLVAADRLLLHTDPATAHRVIATAVARSGEPDDALTALGTLAESHCGGEQALPVPTLPALPEEPAGVARTAVAWRLVTAGRDRTRARDLARSAVCGGRDGLFGARLHACRALLYCDDLAEGGAALDELAADARRAGVPAVAALALGERCWHDLRAGNAARAEEHLEQVLAELPRSRAWPRALEGAVHLARGRTAEAESALRAEPPDEAERGFGWACLLFVRGMLAVEVADPHTALRHFAEAGRVLTTLRWTNPALLPWQILTAAAQHATGDREAAAASVRRAVRLARRWGGPVVLAQTSLWAARASEGDGTPALTGEDNRIAALVAAGRSNAEIANLLGLRRRTVESRLTGVYRALGLAGREQLARLVNGTRED
ncbi:helix-turn-helix transcriptional regulator [Amycolatopsis suaedae]|uniref:helix-turn-helix transcriptional regulator n=1 Tax=Amycolatopsis suaedae TaxID=2510978 RepID=UPI0013EF4A89|nr:LuxR family transcriptional regulator [Amycolatopsis suaedae]